MMFLTPVWKPLLYNSTKTSFAHPSIFTTPSANYMK